MAEGAIETLLRSFARTLESRDLEKALSFFSPDAVYVNPSGRFTGTAEIRRYLRWMFETNSELQIVECGVGILASGNKAVFEHTIRGTFQGKKWELPILCTYESADGKIKRILTLYDRLSMARQVAKGWLPRRAVGAVIKASEKGLQ
jgi:uncharacterized protein (TIGR02246 family)